MKSSNRLFQNGLFTWVGFVLICFGIIFITWWILPTLLTSPRQKMQVELAKELNVDIRDYPPPAAFPSGYFYAILQPGKPISEVHKVVRGYEKVLHCEDISEIYYYFGLERKDAVRFELIYDDEHRYMSFRAEDSNSQTLWTNGCVPGLIQE